MNKILSFTRETLVISISILLGVLSLLATLSVPKGGFLIIFVIIFFVAAFTGLNIRYGWMKFKK